MKSLTKEQRQQVAMLAALAMLSDEERAYVAETLFDDLFDKALSQCGVSFDEASEQHGKLVKGLYE